MTSYTNALSGGLIHPSNMSYAAYAFKDNLILAWPSAFSNNPKVIAAIMDLTAEGEGLSVILPDARHVSVGENILINNRGEADFAVVSRNEAGELAPVIPVLKSGQSFYIYLTDNSQPQGNWNVIPFGAGSVVVTSVGAESNDESALVIEGNPSNPVRSAGLFTFKLSEALRALAVFAKKGLATLTSKGWEGRTLQAGQNIAVKDGDGEKGDPVIATKEDVSFKTVTTEGMKTRTLTTESYTGNNTIKQEALAAESVPLDKTLASGKPCLVYGQTGSKRYFEMDLTDTPFGIVTLGKEGEVNVYNLPSVWYYTKGEYEGSKLRDTSVALDKLTVGSEKGGVVVSRQGTAAASFTEVDETMFGVVSGGGGNGVGFRPLPQVWNLNPYVNSAEGKTLKDGTVSWLKLKPDTNPLAGVKFLDCGVQSNNTHHNFYLFKKTKGTWKSTGVYTFVPTNGYETDYFMPFVTFRGGVYQCEVLQGNKTSFTINVFNKQGNPADASFVILIVGYQ